MDQETKDNVKQLISMSRFRPTATSHHLLSQIRINGALFYGPPGTGKTHLCRAIAKDSGASMIAIDSAAVTSMWVGETEKFIKAAFTLSVKLAPCVLFIDEVDSLFYRRAPGDRGHERKALTQFLQEMDGLATSSDTPFVVVATNRPSDLDEAFLRRLPQKVLFSLPTLDERANILRVFLKEEDLDPLVSIEALAKETAGYSGSDLRSLCGQAALSWATEQVSTMGISNGNPESAKLLLNVHHFAKALKRAKPSVSRREQQHFEEFASRFNPKPN